MKRAKVSGDCRIIANSPPQANTHSKAITINVVTKTCLVLRFVFKGRSAHFFRHSLPAQELRDYRDCAQ